MKKRFRNKTLWSLMSLVAIILPATTLSSCSTISQYICPIETVNHQAYKVSTRYRTNGIDENNKPLTSDFTTVNTPTEYSFKMNFDNSFTPQISNSYAYTNQTSYTYKYQNNGEAHDKYQYNTKSLSNKQWLDPNTLNTNSYNQQTGIITSVDNLINLGANQATNQVSYELINLFLMLNNIQVKVIQTINKQKYTDSWKDGYKRLGVLIGNNDQLTTSDIPAPLAFNFDNSTNNWRKDFFTYLYAHNNDLSYGGTHYSFGPYAIDWNEVRITNSEENNNGSYLSLNDSAFKDGEITIDENHQNYYTNTKWAGQYQFNTDNFELKLDSTYQNNYLEYQFGDKDEGNEPTAIKATASVPVLINLNAIANGFYNPSVNNQSFHASDWIYKQDEINKINETIKNKGSWNSLTTNNLVDLKGTDKYLDNVVYYQRTNNKQANQHKLNWNANEKALFKGFASKGEGDITTITAEPTVKTWIDDNLIQPGTFVALANYTLHATNATVKHGYKEYTVSYSVPYLSGFSELFPSYMLFDANNYKVINKDKGNYQHTVIDPVKIKSALEGLVKNLTVNPQNPNQPVLPDAKAQTYDSEYVNWTQNKFFIFEWLFGLNDNAAFNFKTANTNVSSTNIEFSSKQN